MTEFVPTEEQSEAIDSIIAFWRKKRIAKPFILGGLAGCGKTTIIAETVRQIRQDGAGGKKLSSIRIAFACYTGKAADVLRRKLESAGVYQYEDYCGTIHGLIYEPRVIDEEIVGWKRKDVLDYDFIVIDEGSMITRDIDADLRSYHLPLLYVGDHGQLPPIGGDDFNLMKSLDIKLEKIHRQAEGNPIIHVARLAREEGHIPVGVYGEYVRKISDFNIVDRISSPETATILCGFNTFRVNMNSRIRGLTGIVCSEPIVGDRVICLRNDRNQGIYNGQTGVIKTIADHDDSRFWASIEFDGGFEWEGPILGEQFGNATTKPYIRGEKEPRTQFFDFAYCLSVWKAQGSEFNRVLFYEQRNQHMTDDDWRRFLYTAVTRASERLLIVGV